MVKHLPPAVKQLLSLRNPNPLPSPSASKLSDVFTKTLKQAQAKQAEEGWLVLTTCTLQTVNRPASLGHLYRFATRTSADDPATRTDFKHALFKAALMREAALKGTIFVGVPRTILSLAAMREAFEDDVRSSLRPTVEPHRAATPENIESVVARGRSLWQSIYEPHAQKLFDKLASYHPDFMAFIIQSYGAVLSPLPGADTIQGNLSRALGSVVGIACLRAEERVVPQLTSHVFGLLKARSIENQSAGDQWLSSDEGTEWVIRTVDEIVDTASSEGAEEIKPKL